MIYDEVARFCPQRVEGDVARCVGAVEDIVSLGRSRGLGCALIGQRPATINKTVLTQADNLFAMRTVGTPDRKALDEWVTESVGDREQRDELVRNLATLKQGEGFFWSPALFGVFRRVKFAARTTFDSSRTPKVGEKHVEPTAFAAVDLDALRGEIAATVEKAKADDPKVLRARIAELEKSHVSAQPLATIEYVEVPVVGDSLIDALRESFERWEHVVTHIRGDFEAINAALARVKNTEIPPVAPAEGARQDARERRSGGRSNGTGLPAMAPAQTSPPALPRSPSSSDAIGGGPMKILEALAGARDGGATRTQLGFLSGYAAGGGSFGRYMSTLRSAGLVSGDGSTIVITDAGRAIAGKPSAVTTADVHAMWRSKLKAGSLKMFDALVSIWPRGMTREQLADATGYEAAGGSFGRYLSTLSGQDIIERRGAVIVISDALFPTGPR